MTGLHGAAGGCCVLDEAGAEGARRSRYTDAAYGKLAVRSPSFGSMTDQRLEADFPFLLNRDEQFTSLRSHAVGSAVRHLGSTSGWRRFPGGGTVASGTDATGNGKRQCSLLKRLGCCHTAKGL